MSQKRKKSYIFQPVIAFLFLSFFSHILIALLFTRIPHHWMDLKQRPASEPIEVEFKAYEPPQTKKRILVDDSTIGKRVEKLKKLTEFISKHNKEVKKQTVRKTPRKRSKKKSQEFTKRRIRPKKLQQNNGDIFQSARPFTKKLNIGPQLRHYLPDIQEGRMTALNTNQVLYYSFFKRINDRVYYKWLEELKLTSRHLNKNQRRRLTFRDRTTRIEIVLDAKGNYVDSMVHRSSGSKPLDKAAIMAFVNSAPHLNPPKDLIETDGLIRLNYSFTLLGRHTPFAKKRTYSN